VFFEVFDGVWGGFCWGFWGFATILSVFLLWALEIAVFGGEKSDPLLAGRGGVKA